MRICAWRGQEPGLRCQLFVVVTATLAVLYAAGLYLSAMDVRSNFNREYVEKGELLAQAIDASVIHASVLQDREYFQAHLDRLSQLAGDVLEVSVYQPVQGRLVETASTNQKSIGRPGDMTQMQAMLSNLAFSTEPAGQPNPVLEVDAPLHAEGRPVGVISISMSLAQRDALVAAHIIKFALLGFVALALLQLILYYVLEARLLKPLVGVGQAAATMAQGNLAVRLPEKEPARELGQLARLFNKMAESLQTMSREQRDLLEQLRGVHFSTIRALAAAIDARDPYTHGHSERVAALAVATGRRLGLSPQELEGLEVAGLLHDVGKIGVPDDILRERAPLSPEAWVTLMSHPSVGAAILQEVPDLRWTVPLVKHHHERYDGTGYPEGLRGAQISLGARILAVVDAFDAMTSDRIYRRAMAFDVALREIEQRKGTQFDPRVVDAFLAVVPWPGVAIAPAARQLSSGPRMGLKPELAAPPVGVSEKEQLRVTALGFAPHFLNDHLRLKRNGPAEKTVLAGLALGDQGEMPVAPAPPQDTLLGLEISTENVSSVGFREPGANATIRREVSGAGDE